MLQVGPTFGRAGGTGRGEVGQTLILLSNIWSFRRPYYIYGPPKHYKILYRIIDIVYCWWKKTFLMSKSTIVLYFLSIMIWRNVQMIAVINFKRFVLNTYFFVDFKILTEMLHSLTFIRKCITYLNIQVLSLTENLRVFSNAYI